MRAIALEFGAFVEDLAKRVLDDGDVLPDRQLAAGLGLDIGRARKVIGMHMRLDQPFHLEPVVTNEGDDPVGAVIGDTPGGIVDIHHRIDHRAGLGVRVLDHIGNGVGWRVEEGGHFRLHRKVGGESKTGHEKLLW